MGIIEFKNVDFSYVVEEDVPSSDKTVTREVEVLKNFNLNIEEGSFVAILGHNEL